MKKILLNIFLIINIIFVWHDISYSSEKFSLYGVCIGDNYDDVKENGIKRGYNVIDFTEFSITGYGFNILMSQSNKNLHEKILSIVQQPFETLFNEVEKKFFNENIFGIHYDDSEKLVSLDIYFTKVYEDIHEQLKVFLIIPRSNIEKIIETFNKRYGNGNVIEYKSKGWGGVGDDKYYIWKNGDIIALGKTDFGSQFFLVDTSEFNEIYETIYNDYIFEKEDKDRKEKELQKKRDEEI